MPWNTGSGDLHIVGRRDIGELGDIEGPPTVVAWNWFYILPSMGFWGLAVLPLLVAKENWRPRAWAILIPLLVILIFWNWITVLFNLSASTSTYTGIFISAIATGWAVLWALGDRFRSRWRFANFFMAWLLMSVMVTAVMMLNGSKVSNGLVGYLIYQTVAVVALLLPMALSAFFCRETYSPKKFMLFLFLWTLLTPVAELVLLLPVLVLFLAMNPSVLLVIVPMMLLFSGLFGVGLYLLNLPFMLLAFNNSLYKERFLNNFGLREDDIEETPIKPELIANE